MFIQNFIPLTMTFFKQDFQNVQTTLSQHEQTTGKSVVQYLNSQLVPLLKSHLVEPAIKRKTDYNWTDNNSEY